MAAFAAARRVLRLARGRAVLGAFTGTAAGLATSQLQQQRGYAFASSPDVSLGVLRREDATSSDAVITQLSASRSFVALAKAEAAAIIARDTEDDEKLMKGVELSISRGVLPRITPPKVTKIDVEGKSPDDVAGIILGAVTGGGGKKGSVIVLQGMSGTGKGTTAAKLMESLPRSAAWSNGNVFRSLTLLANAEHGDRVQTHSAEVMTTENVRKWMSYLTFFKAGNEKYDIHIKAPSLGIDCKVSEVQNTLLKTPAIGKAIPSVAQYTQGDVVKFAAQALQQMADDGMNVILEGRGPTVQYVPTQHRYELMLSNSELLGKRRAAQRIIGKALLSGKSMTDADSASDLVAGALDALAKERSV